MVTRNRSILIPALFLFAILLAGCADMPTAANPTGMAFVDRFLTFLANPNVTYLLLVLGLLALLAEVATPGAVIPGVAGVIMLLLSLYSLMHLPTNWLGLMLIIVGVAMMLIDIKVPGIALSIGGVIAFLLGSLLIFTPPWVELAQTAAPVVQLNPWLIAATTLGVALFFFFGIAAAYKAQLRPLAVGTETLIGRTGYVRQQLHPGGIVHIEGEEWTAENATGEDIPAGARIRVIGIDGLRLRVERANDHPERS
jgi:membrane-bound serine protease (ClpP class)